MKEGLPSCGRENVVVLSPVGQGLAVDRVCVAGDKGSRPECSGCIVRYSHLPARKILFQTRAADTKPERIDYS